MITSDRDEFIGFHTYPQVKDALRAEAERRRVSMSYLISTWLEERLKVAATEQVDPVRSNKRPPKIWIAPVKNHEHTFDDEGNPTCGCKGEEDLPLPFTD